VASRAAGFTFRIGDPMPGAAQSEICGKYHLVEFIARFKEVAVEQYWFC